MTRKLANTLGIKPLSGSEHGDVGGDVAQNGTPYAARIGPFLSPLVVPCTQPPFGMLSAVDLNSRRVVWARPFGTATDSGPLLSHSKLPFTIGLPNLGGAVATRGGLIFIAAAQDNYLRAFATEDGREVWRARLPAGGQATPISYWSSTSGRQFVLIAAGGHPAMMTASGDYILAFALPRH